MYIHRHLLCIQTDSFSDALCQQLEECQSSEIKLKEELSLKISQLTEAEEKIATLTENITSLSEKIGFYVRQENEFSVSYLLYVHV